MPRRVAPSAKAPSFSPGGAWENTSRMTEVEIGITISDTTMPAMNGDERKRASSAAKNLPTIGTFARWAFIHSLTGTNRGCRKKNPHRP
jgi:hypothetical protein